MSRGRKPTSYLPSNNWEDIFWNSLPTYIGILNTYFTNNNYEFVAIGDCLKKLSFTIPKGLNSKEIHSSGKHPVISQSKEYIIGFSERTDLLVDRDLPLIVFGDHSKTIKYVDEPFIIGADGVKLVKPISSFNERFFYYFIFGIITDTKDYGRHFSLLRNGLIAKVEDLELQIKVVEFLDTLKSNAFSNKYVFFNASVENEIYELQKNQLKGNTISTELTNQLSLVKKLRQQLLQDAVQGKLVAPSPLERAGGEVEPASELLKKIKAERLNRVGFQPDPKKDIGLKPNKFSNHSSGLKPRAIKELPPIKPEDIPFEIPENWIWCRLGEICTKITDGFHNTPPKVSEGIPYIAATQVKSDKIDWENCNYVDEKYHRELFIKAYPQQGELLVVNIGAGCGTPAIIDVDFEFSFKNTAILKFNQSLVSNKLLFYYFLSRKEQIYAELTKGGLQPFLSLKILNEIDFPLPPIAEQIRIVQKLDELMQHCNELEASIKQSESQNEKLLQQVLREALRKEPLEV
jgi:type I restriction enzyme S subunit